MIKFLCPNGHPLSAPENLAGKPGKCPKCNTPFVVPPPDDAEGSATDDLAAAGSGIATPAMGSGKGLGGGTFMFLCPNGHRLNGPPSLKGKAGQCPHCGVRFRIPTDDELDATDDELGLADEAEDSPDADRIDFNRLFGAGGEGQPAGLPPGGAGLGIIFARLWQERTDATELEIFLTEGEIVVPDYYAAALSRSDYGVFAVEEGDGSFAITVVPWSSVRRVSMRRAGELPREFRG
jgi:hypothetical protein